MNKGVVYKTTGAEYIEEASVSAKSVKENASGVETAIITDERVDFPHFDHVIHCDNLNPDFSNKILEPGQSPFERTLFLDTDTYVDSDLTGLFKVLDRYDMAFCWSRNKDPVPEMPGPYREFNSGVYIFKDNERTRDFFKNWKECYWEFRESKDIIVDQPSFAYSMHNSDVDYTMLPREYNSAILSVGLLSFESKILHDRPQEELPKITKKLNREVNKRRRLVYYVRPGLITDWNVDVYNMPEIHIRFRRSVRNDGFLATIKKCVRRLGNEINLP